jgi:membrane protease YdiL (CAAX protease family)
LVRAVAAGLFVGLIGTLAWALLAGANIKHLPTIPWATPVMACVLVAWWFYFAKGRGWPEATAEARRRGARANRVPAELWGPALGAGALGLLTTLLLQGVLGRLVTLPQQRDLDPSKYPVLTIVAWVMMSAVVSGVVEETAFRGYMQGGIERRHGLTTAILVSGGLFGLVHFTHPEVGLVLLPFYLAVATVYGLVASATNSTFPGMILHAGGNMFAALNLFTQGRSEWQLTGVPQPTIWHAGIDGAFMANLAALAVAGAVTVTAYRGLFKAAAAAPEGGRGTIREG